MELIKKYKIITYPSFEEDLEKIYNYLSNILKEPNIANNLYGKVIHQISSLKYFPERNMKIFKFNKKNVRRMIIYNYVLIYEVKRNTRSGFYITYFSL